MTNQIPTVIIDTELQSIELSKLYLQELDYIQITEEFTDMIAGYNAVLENRPSIVIFDISHKTDLALDIINKISINHKT
ncbi:MAG: hypothetical protein WCG95_04135 [bacterium]